MSALDALFEQFLRERLYLKNVTPKTRVWYQTAWKTYLQSCPEPPTTITRSDLQRFIVTLRDRGVQPVSCNSWLRAMNAFCRWLHEEGHATTPARLQPLRLEKKIRRTHPEAELRAILTFRPQNFAQWRVYTLVLAILDTGCRIQELLGARTNDFDLPNLLLIVNGKRRKERRVPFSAWRQLVLPVSDNYFCRCRGSKRVPPTTWRDSVTKGRLVA